MEKLSSLRKKQLPPWAGWVLGYVLVLFAAFCLVYYWRVVFMLGSVPFVPFSLGVASVFTLLYLVLFLLFRFCRDNLCLKAALLVFAFGLLFCFATAPLQAPDEINYFLRAYSISNGHFNFDYTRLYPQDVNALVKHFPAAMNHRIQYAMEDMAPLRFVHYQNDLLSGIPLSQEREPIVFMILPFLPQAFGMAVARLFGFSALGMMYAGRIANLLCYSALCYFTFRNCDKYRGIFFSLALLPLSLFMAASNSSDSIMLALCYLMVSYFCKKEVHNRDVILFGLASLYVIHLKPMNVVLPALLLLIPKNRWKSKFHPWAAMGIIIASGILFYWGMGQINSLLASGYPAELPRGAGEAPDPAGQIQFVLSNLPRFAAVALLALYENAGFLFNIGVFGWMDVSIPLVGGISLLSMSSAAALGIQQKEDSSNTTVIALALAALLYSGAVLLGMYIFETDIYSIRIIGSQPRYFLPVFLLLFMTASILLGKAVQPRLALSAKTEKIALWIAAGTAMVSVILLFQNSFIGQWFPKTVGGWKLVNMLGWQIQ